MHTATLGFPVTCPTCGQDRVQTLPVDYLAASLSDANLLLLSSPCHGRFWNASDSERAQIRNFLTAMTQADASIVAA